MLEIIENGEAKFEYDKPLSEKEHAAKWGMWNGKFESTAYFDKTFLKIECTNCTFAK